MQDKYKDEQYGTMQHFLEISLGRSNQQTVRDLVAQEVATAPSEAASASRKQPKGSAAAKRVASMRQKSLSIELPSKMCYDNGSKNRSQTRCHAGTDNDYTIIRKGPTSFPGKQEVINQRISHYTSKRQDPGRERLHTITQLSFLDRLSTQ